MAYCPDLPRTIQDFERIHLSASERAHVHLMAQIGFAGLYDVLPKILNLAKRVVGRNTGEPVLRHPRHDCLADLENPWDLWDQLVEVAGMHRHMVMLYRWHCCRLVLVQ